jgi:hypothetical protein
MALTLDQISTFVCGKVGQVDAASLALCYAYVNMRFRMVAESFPWRDLQIIPSDINTVSGQSYVLLPAGVDRIISIRCNGTMLEPTNSTLQIETNPTYFDTTGVPQYYEEYTEVSDNSKRIRLFPIPNAIFALKIVARRTPNTLTSASDTPILRNIDNVLIAYAMGDMLERQRQYGKAAEKFKEAGALLEVAKQLENAQSNAPRTTKNITVTGDSLLEMTDAVCARCGTWAQEQRILVKDFIRRNYRRVHDANLWKDTLSKVTANTINAQAFISMPAGLQRIVSISQGSEMLEPVNSMTLMQTDPGIFATSGTPKFFEEYDDAGTKKVRLIPTPNAIIALNIVGKKTVETLAADSDTISIRNVGNVIIDAASADMFGLLDKKEQAEKYASSSQNALKGAIDLEAQQTFFARTAKPLSVTGDSLGEMVDAVCARCSMWTQQDRILAKDFVRRNYRRVHDSHLWKDTVDNTTANTVNAQGYIAMPTGYQRVISIGIVASSQMLEPIDSATFVQTDPSIFTRTGVPQFFEEYDSAGAKRIRLLPIPNAVYALTIVGKKTIDTLAADADVIPIRGVGNVIIDMSCADMLNGKEQAGAFAKAAQDGLKTAIELEERQTFRARMAKPLTVSGDSLAEMADAVCSKAGVWTQEAVISAKEFLRRNYQMLWDSELWPESVVAAKVNSDGAQIILPEYFERVLSVRPNSDAAYELAPADVPLYLQLTPLIFEDEGEAVAYSTLTSVAVHSLPPTNEKLIFVSTSATDKSNIFVRGETLGGQVRETVTLNGTTPVVSANTYDTPLTIAKGITVGTIHISGQTSSIALQSLPPDERERKHMRLWLQPSPGVSEKALVIGKRKIRPLVSDEDTPMLRKVANALISSAVADLLESLGKDPKSARERAAAALQIIKDGELRQNARQPRVVPSIESCFSPDNSYADSWFVAK